MQASGRCSRPVTVKSTPESRNTVRALQWASRRRRSSPGRKMITTMEGRTNRAMDSQTRQGTNEFNGLERGCMGRAVSGLGLRIASNPRRRYLLSKYGINLTYKCEPRHGAYGKKRRDLRNPDRTPGFC